MRHPFFLVSKRHSTVKIKGVRSRVRSEGAPGATPMFSAPPPPSGNGDGADVALDPAQERFRAAVEKVLTGYRHPLALGPSEFLALVGQAMGDPDVAALHEDSTVKARIREITRAWPLQRRLGRWQGAELSAVLKINGLKPGGNRDAMISRIQTYMERGPLPKCPTCEKTYLRWVQADGRWRPDCPGFYGGKDVGMIACAGPQEVIPIPPFTWGENVAVRQTPAKQPPSEGIQWQQ